MLIYTSVISWTFVTKSYKTELDPVRSGVACGNTTKVTIKIEDVRVYSRLLLGVTIAPSLVLFVLKKQL